MKNILRNLLILSSFVIVISCLPVDNTAPVLTIDKDQVLEVRTDRKFNIYVDVDDDEATCLWEQTSGPKIIPGPIPKKSSYRFANACNLTHWDILRLNGSRYDIIPLKAPSEPGEMIFRVTAKDNAGNASTITIPITVVHGAPPKGCKNGEEKAEDSYGSYCCYEDMSIFYPNAVGSTVMDIKLEC